MYIYTYGYVPFKTGLWRVSVKGYTTACLAWGTLRAPVGSLRAWARAPPGPSQVPVYCFVLFTDPSMGS